MKKFLFTSLLWAFAISVQAQNEISQPRATQIAGELCTCFNIFLADYHPLMQQMFKDIAEQGQDIAMENFSEKFTQLPPGEQQRILDDSQRMKEKGINDVPCMNDLKEKYPDADTNKTLQQQVQTELEKLPKCAFMARMLTQQKAKKVGPNND